MFYRRTHVLLGLAAAFFCAPLFANEKTRSPAVCEQIARIANLGQFKTGFRREDPYSAGPFEHPEIRHLQYLGRIHLADRSEGHAWARGERAGVIAFRDAQTEIALVPDPAIDWDAERYHWMYPTGMFLHDGREYFVWGSAWRLGLVTRIESDLTEKVVCEFGQKGEKARRLLKGSGPVCEAARDENIDRVRFDLAQKEIRIPSRDGVDFRTQGGAALVDIDGDGRAERIAETSTSEIGVNPCDYKGIVLLDRGGEKVVTNAAQRPVLSVGGECGHRGGAFVHGGSFYIEVREAVLSPLPADRVYEVKGRELQMLCEIESLPINFVLP